MLGEDVERKLNVPAATLNETLRLIILRTSEFELAWSREDGSLRIFRRLDGNSVVGHGPLQAGVDVALHAPGNWLTHRSFARYLSHQYDDCDGAVALTIIIGLGVLKLYDRYRITGDLVERRVAIQNVDSDDVRVYGLRMAIPYARAGRPETCSFEAPGNSVRPRVPLSVAADQRRGVLPRRFFAPGLRGDTALEPAPTQGPGLLALHNRFDHDEDTAETLLCWYYSTVEAALPFVEGSPDTTGFQQPAVSLGHEVYLAGWLGPDEMLEGGTQYIMLRRESWSQALETFRCSWALSGLNPPPEPVEWVRDAAIYETHPALHGGFAGLTDLLPALAALGINTLVLLPIWSFANPEGRLWDGNWSASGSPYAIRDFEVLDPTLGTPADLRALVERAHSLEMRVLVDFAAQGCAAGSRYVIEHPDWFVKDEMGSFVTTQCPGTPLRFMDYYSFDWNNHDLQTYLHTWALDQIRQYNIDGYRVVSPYSSALNWKRRLPQHASAASLGLLPLLRRLRQDLRQLKDDAVLLCELYGPVYNEMHAASYDYLVHHMFVHMALNRLTPAELGDYLHDHTTALPRGSVRICFMEKHDTCDMNPLVDGMRGSRISRMLLAGMVFCGFVPAIWSNQEQSEGRSIAELLHVRREYPVLRYGDTLYNAVWCDSPQVFAVVRVLEDVCVLGLLNVGPYKQTVTLSLPVEALNLADINYRVRELLKNRIWTEDRYSSWRRDELRHMRLTLEPFGAYCLALEPQTV